MPIIIVGKEKDLAAVATRVLNARASKSAHADAVTALKAANPGVDHDRLSPGTVLVVPEVTGARADIDGAHPGSVAVLTGQVKAALKELADAVDAHAEQEAASRQRTARTIAAPDLEQIAADDPALRARLEDLGRTVKADAEAAAADTERIRSTVQQWAAALEEVRPAEQ